MTCKIHRLTSPQKALHGLTINILLEFTSPATHFFPTVQRHCENSDQQKETYPLSVSQKEHFGLATDSTCTERGRRVYSKQPQHSPVKARQNQITGSWTEVTSASIFFLRYTSSHFMGGRLHKALHYPVPAQTYTTCVVDWALKTINYLFKLLE